MKKFKYMFLVSTIMVFNLSLGMEIDANRDELEQQKANCANAEERLKYNKRRLSALSSSSNSSDSSPASISDNEKDLLIDDSVIQFPLTSEDEATDFPTVPAPRIMKRRSRKQNNLISQPQVRKQIAQSFPCDCTRSEWGAIGAALAVVGAGCYQIAKYKYSKPRTK